MKAYMMFFKTNSVRIEVCQKKKFFLGLKSKVNVTLVMMMKL